MVKRNLSALEIFFVNYHKSGLVIGFELNEPKF